MRHALVFCCALLTVVPLARAQDAPAPGDTGRAPAFRARFPRAPLPVPAHPALAPGGRLAPRIPPAPPLPTPPPAPEAAPGPLARYADVGMDLRLRFELKADQFRNLRCTSAEQRFAATGCGAGFPAITPLPQYAIRSTGLIGERLHVNVDFDSEREFDANNNLRVWYQGLEGEALRRVEAGNVTFSAPASRFITAAIPANNFGVQAVAQLGALELRGIYAQQGGNVVTDRVYTVGETTTQPIDRAVRDVDYETGRFFFAVDPAALPGAPAVDILEIDPTGVPDSLRVGALRVYRVRPSAPAASSNPSIGGVRAVACGAGGPPPACADRAGPYQWEILLEGRDYYVDPSGAWFALATRLDVTDYLAVSYVTASGLDSIGTFPAAANPDTSVVDTLRLVYDPRPGVTAASAAFRFEFRGAYRVGGSEVRRETVELAVTVNQRERTVATAETYLGLLGLAVLTDASRFDQYNRLFPRERDPLQGAPVRDFFVVFPHLAPFADSARLQGAERNDSLYRTPRPRLVTEPPPSVFTLGLRADVSSSGDRGVLSLNSFQIREGSEKIYLGGRLLARGVDYTIDYTIGQVQFTAPDALFGTGTGQVRVQFEERAALDLAPTSIFGVAGRYDLGAAGQVHLTGLFQREQTAFSRPPLGFEPSSGFIGGLSTRLRFAPEWLTRAVDALPGVRAEAPSAVSFAAELAVSKPTPNARGQAYVEEFEGEAGRFVPLVEQAWQWGSRPCGDPATGCQGGARGAAPFGIDPSGFDGAHAAALTWQGVPLDAVGAPVQFLAQDIDPTIRLTGQAQGAETALWLVLHADTVLGLADNNPGSPRYGQPNWLRPPQAGPRWRSITQTLSPAGLDLSRVEFLEVWVWEDGSRTARANGAALLFDFGSLFEDAVAFVPQSFQVVSGDTTYLGVRPAGAGRLDTERDPVTQSWNAAVHDVGVLSDRVVDGILNLTTGESIDTLPLCGAADAAGRRVLYALGDLRSRCGRDNGFVDGEDGDGDLRLDSLAGVRSREDFVRYVLPVGDPRYFVRDGGMRDVPGSGLSRWRLYRLPFRTDTLRVGEPSLRQVQTLRVTFVTPDTAAPGGPDARIPIALARLRLVGSSWLKRAETPIAGVAGEGGTGVGGVVVSVVSTENRDLGYTSPPGVTDAAGRRDAGLQLGAVQINERSLRLLARGLDPGERAEAFLRFTAAGDKNFLKYRRLRVWARGRGPGWEDGDLEFYLKAGKDAQNFYLYRTPARTTTWEPEVVIDLERWVALRAAVERAWLGGDTARVYPGCPDSTLVPHDSSYVMCDGPYLVHVRDPGTAPPNLASVQELAAGILRVGAGGLIDEAELWVDDIRLSDVVAEAGIAAALDLSVAAADVADVTVSVTRRDGQFRQLGDDPSYVTDDAVSVSGGVRLERFLPASWGIALPVTARYTRAASDPLYLARTDLRAEALDGLRTPLASGATYGFSLRRVERSAGLLGRLLVDPLAVSGTHTRGRSRSDLSGATAAASTLDVAYRLVPEAVRWLGLRLTPSVVTLRSSFTASDGTRVTYQVPVVRPADTLLAPVRSRTRTWRNTVGLELAPAGGVRVRVDLSSMRDLRDYDDSTTLGRVIRGERRTLLGRDVGFEAQRALVTFVGLTPRLGDWVSPRATLTSTFAMTRDPNAPGAVRERGDTAGAFRLPAAFANARRLELGARIDLRRLGERVWGEASPVTRLLARLSGGDLAYTRQRGSSFSRSPNLPSLGYQLGFGGFDAFRRVGGRPAVSAVQMTTFTAAAGVTLPLGLRAGATFQETRGETWALRNQVQVPIRTRSRDWPAVTASWSVTPPQATLGRVLASLTAQLTVRRRETDTEQRGLAGAPVRSTGVQRSAGPSLTATWRGGVVTSLDVFTADEERLQAGNVFHTSRRQRNALVSLAFRPPGGLGRLPAPVRATARLASVADRTCLRTAGQAACVPVVDSRQTDAQVTLDTDLPSSVSAGFQLAYLRNEERQVDRKTSQLVVTAFVTMATTVGRLR